MTNTEWRDMHPQWNPLASSLDSTGVLELTVCARPPEARALLFRLPTYSTHRHGSAISPTRIIGVPRPLRGTIGHARPEPELSARRPNVSARNYSIVGQLSARVRLTAVGYGFASQLRYGYGYGSAGFLRLRLRLRLYQYAWPFAAVAWCHELFMAAAATAAAKVCALSGALSRKRHRARVGSGTYRESGTCVGAAATATPRSRDYGYSYGSKPELRLRLRVRAGSTATAAGEPWAQPAPSVDSIRGPGPNVFDLSVSGPPLAPSEGPGPLFGKQK